MKAERGLSFGVALVLAFLISLGSVGCLATGFGMNVDLTGLALVCLAASVLSAFLAGRKWGGFAILSGLILGVALFCMNKTARQQLMDLIRWISDFYYRAYHWDWLWHGETDADALGYPLGFLGILVATRVSWTVVRREDTFSAVLAALLPLGACLVVTDTVPQVQFLYLLLAGVLLLILTAGLRKRDQRQANLLTLLAALPLALALWGLFLATPEESYVNKAQEFYQQILEWYPSLTEQPANGAVTGIREEIQLDLREIGPLNQRYQPVMDVVAPTSGTMYLRGQDFDLYDGTGWTATPEREEVLYPTPDFMVSQGAVTVATLQEQDICYVPYYSGVGTKLTGGASRNPQRETVYSFALRTLPEGWRKLGVVESQSVPAVDERYLELPEDTRVWAETLVDEILPEGLTVTTDKAEIIAAYVRDSAKYRINTGKMPRDQQDFVRWFLTESDTGYCTHFASATAVLLRAAGIPARYVTGYMLEAQAGVPVTVRENQAHAWVEYYEERLGMWLVLESTPSQEDLPEETKPSQPQTDETRETTGATEPEDTVQTDPTQPEETQPTRENEWEGSVTKPTQQDAQPEEIPEEVPENRGNKWIWLLLALVIVAFLWGQRSLRLALRRKQARRGDSNHQALARWRELELLYRRLGKTPPQELEALAQKARFSQYLLTGEELRRLDAGIAQARRLCGEKPWYQRLVDRWFYAAY